MWELEHPPTVTELCDRAGSHIPAAAADTVADAAMLMLCPSSALISCLISFELRVECCVICHPSGVFPQSPRTPPQPSTSEAVNTAVNFPDK